MINPLWKIDFHCHTYRSKDSLNLPGELIAQARSVGLSRLILTDHNNIHGALETQEMAPDYVIVGEEIQTSSGELLACFVTREVPRGLSPREAIERLREQGAFISVSHPYDYKRSGWKPQELLEIAPLVDAIEVFNARCTESRTNTLAARFAREHGVAGTAGSDAHSIREVGRAWVELLPFSSADELRQSIRKAVVRGNLSSPFIHFTSTWARIVKAWRKNKTN